MFSPFPDSVRKSRVSGKNQDGKPHKDKFIEWEVTTQLSQPMIKTKEFSDNYGCRCLKLMTFYNILAQTGKYGSAELQNVCLACVGPRFHPEHTKKGEETGRKREEERGKGRKEERENN